MANYPYYNPYQLQPNYPMPAIQQPQQQVQSGIIWVTGINEAMGFQVLPNAAVALWDSNAPCIYLKQADQTGKPTMRILDIVERTQQAPAQNQTADYITREEFQDLASRVEELFGKTEHLKEGKK